MNFKKGDLISPRTTTHTESSFPNLNIDEHHYQIGKVLKVIDKSFHPRCYWVFDASINLITLWHENDLEIFQKNENKIVLNPGDLVKPISMDATRTMKGNCLIEDFRKNMLGKVFEVERKGANKDSYWINDGKSKADAWDWHIDDLELIERKGEIMKLHPGDIVRPVSFEATEHKLGYNNRHRRIREWLLNKDLEVQSTSGSPDNIYWIYDENQENSLKWHIDDLMLIRRKEENDFQIGDIVKVISIENSKKYKTDIFSEIARKQCIGSEFEIGEESEEYPDFFRPIYEKGRIRFHWHKDDLKLVSRKKEMKEMENIKFHRGDIVEPFKIDKTKYRFGVTETMVDLIGKHLEVREEDDKRVSVWNLDKTMSFGWDPADLKLIRRKGEKKMEKFTLLKEFSAKTVLEYKPDKDDFAALVSKFEYGPWHEEVINWIQKEKPRCWIEWLVKNGFIKKAERIFRADEFELVDAGESGFYLQEKGNEFGTILKFTKEGTIVRIKGVNIAGVKTDDDTKIITEN